MVDECLRNDQVEILIVEDSPTQAEELRYTLERHSFAVSVASNGIEALSRIRERKPTIIISDVIMPMMDGYQLSREIKNDDALKELPVILLTALSDPWEVIKGLECEADYFITKPYKEKYILSRIQYILANSHLRETENTNLGVEVILAGKKHYIRSDRIQILNLLISSFEAAIQKNGELNRIQDALMSFNEQLEEKVLARTAALMVENKERERAKEALEKAREEWERTFNAIIDPIMILDADFRVVKANRAMSDKLGMPPAAAVGLSCSREAHGTDESLPCCPHAQLLADGQPHSTEIYASHFGGHFSVVVSPIFSPDGKLHGSVCHYRDITERKNLENQLRQAQKMEAIGTLAGGIAHDFNNVLTAIIGFGNLMEMKMSVDDPLLDHVRQILTAADRAAGLTRSLLALGRKQEIEVRAVSLNDIIRGVEKMLAPLLREDVELKTALAEDELVIMADPGQIEQVLMNLATNARDAMPKGGTLTIGTMSLEIDQEFREFHGYGEPGRYALLTFSDSGEGMDETTRQRVFEPFFTTKEMGRGTGLGLSVCYGIVKQHNGYINCYSEPERGTTFRTYLPMVTMDAQKRELPRPVTFPTGTETILLAEDDEQVRLLNKEVLERFGYTVVEATDGKDAVAKFIVHRDQIELAIIDVIMPRMNGREAYTEIMLINPRVGVIFTSGYTADVFREETLNVEGADFLTKPIVPSELLKCVRKVLDENRRAVMPGDRP